MTDAILVTGATGKLGSAVLERLPTGTHVRALSRKARTGSDGDRSWLSGDLRSGAGIGDAVRGAGVIVHCATTNGRGDVGATRNLIAAAEHAGGAHLVYISIVGIERIPMFYYRAKLEAERLIERCGLPWTILRATQFHDLVAAMTRAQRFSPAVLTPAGVRFQPIDTGEVAARLAELAGEPSAGRVPDIGGPQVRDAAELARATLRADGRHRPVLPVPVPGKTFRAYRAGANLVPGESAGDVTFEQFLAARAGAR